MRDSDLDDLLAAARADRPEPSAALMARVLDDARRLQPAMPLPPRRAPVRPGLLARLSYAFGGAGALAGMAAAMLAGVWVGVAQPAPFTTLTAALWPAEALSVELIPDPAALWEPEG